MALRGRQGAEDGMGRQWASQEWGGSSRRGDGALLHDFHLLLQPGDLRK